MKYILYAILLTTIIFSASCVCSSLKQEQRQLAALAIEKAKTIELPVIYCARHGSHMIFVKLTAKFQYYSTYSGKAYFHIIYHYRCPCSNFLTRWYHGGFSNYDDEDGSIILRYKDTCDENYPYEDVDIDSINSGTVEWVE